MGRQSTIPGTDQAGSSITRATSEGKTIRYDLEILQQRTYPKLRSSLKGGECSSTSMKRLDTY